MDTRHRLSHTAAISALFCTLLTACGGGGGGEGLVSTAGATPSMENSGSNSSASGAATGITSGSLSGSSSGSASGAASLMPRVNAAMIPPATAGSAVDRVMTATEAVRGSDGTGNFRTVCDYSHMAFDDPIVFPGQPGRSHLHTFFGNTAVTGNSTAASIANTGNSTCRGGLVNRSAYWVPAMIDTRDGTPVRPTESHFYYKTGYRGVTPQSVQSVPLGFRMIAGDTKNASPSGQFSYSCHGANPSLEGKGIPNCPVGSELWQAIYFPQCWDGVNLDSPDHKSHVAYPIEGRGCPSSHPVALPEITFNIVYPVTQANSTRNWRLASDNYSTSLPGGYSAHGDWFNGWRQDVMDLFVQNCDRAAVDCGSGLLGDGRALY